MIQDILRQDSQGGDAQFTIGVPQVGGLIALSGL